MFHNRHSSILFLSIIGYLAIWVLTALPNWPHHWFHHLRGIGTFIGVAGYLFLSLALLLSSRWKIIENWIGGLDYLYHIHHQLGVWGFLFSLLHPLILAVRWIPRWDKFFLSIFPIYERLSLNLGSFSFLLMLILIAITYLKFIPYDKWKITHKLMSMVFILATLHIIFLERRFSPSYASYLLLFIPMGIGFFGIIYKQIISDFIIKHPLFEVVKTEIINDNLIEIFIRAKTKKLSFVPGQYVFCRFETNELTRESHPFTLCGSPDSSILSILVKARGDFTRSLYQSVKIGDLLRLEGPYGRFDYTQAGPSQIWIAGGIGIAPFLAWARLFHQRQEHISQIDLFYCVHRKTDIAFVDEFRDISQQFPFFRFFLFCSEENERLSLEKIQKQEGDLAGKKILMCGPKRLTQNFKKQFQALGVKKENIIFEDFEFF